jgi:hypothetical protein
LKKLIFEVTQMITTAKKSSQLTTFRSMARRRVWSIVLRIWSKLLKTHAPILRRPPILSFNLMTSCCPAYRNSAGNSNSRTRRRRKRSRSCERHA